MLWYDRRETAWNDVDNVDRADSIDRQDMEGPTLFLLKTSLEKPSRVSSVENCCHSSSSSDSPIAAEVVLVGDVVVAPRRRSNRRVAILSTVSLIDSS